MFDIKVKVYDHVGSEVWSVENHNVSSGRYSVEFNANNLPSGMYFYTLFVNGVLADTRRMILVK